MITETTITTKRSVLKATISRTPATLNEARAKNPRWFLEVGEANIISAEVVGVNLEFASCPSSTPRWSYYLEITTKTGKGIVFLGHTPEGSCADHNADLCAFIPSKGAAKVWGIFVCKKYGQWRGSPMAYLIAHKKGVKTCCGTEIYHRLAGKAWGEAA